MNQKQVKDTQEGFRRSLVWVGEGQREDRTPGGQGHIFQEPPAQNQTQNPSSPLSLAVNKVWLASSMWYIALPVKHRWPLAGLLPSLRSPAPCSFRCSRSPEAWQVLPKPSRDTQEMLTPAEGYSSPPRSTRTGVGCVAPYHFEAAGDVTAEDPRFQRFHVASHVCLRVQHVAIFCKFVEFLLLLVGEDDVGMIGLNHQQCLAQCPRSFS